MMSDVIDLEELRRISATLRRIQADQGTMFSRVDGIERRLAIIEERQAEVEAAIRAAGEDLTRLDRKLDTVVALVRDDVARLEAQLADHRAEMDRKFAEHTAAMDVKFAAMDQRFDAVLAAIAANRPPGRG